MSKRVNTLFTRGYAAILERRLEERRRLIQVVTGARQVGKTTMVRQATMNVAWPVHFASADEALLEGPEWLGQQWNAARDIARVAPNERAVLVLDEVQKTQDWSVRVKRYWDEDTHTKLQLHVVLLGSAPLLVQRGLGESLAGRFEVIHLPHWSFDEMRTAFGFTLEQYVFYGGFPGAAPLIDDHERWRRYILDSLLETTISRDVLLLSRVEKPALLRRLLELGCRYSGQVLSFNKMLGQLQDAGNTTTLAHYLELLAGAGILTGLPKFAGHSVRTRASSPKLQVLNTALIGAQSNVTLDQAQRDRELWGRLSESAVGAHLANAAAAGVCELFYWRDHNREVDFVIRAGKALAAIEVKSGRRRETTAGISAFAEAWRPARTLVVGRDDMPLVDFLATPVQHWLGTR
ncbi:MAG: AAA family ATPase [Gemmatimonadota bacterium]